MKVCEAGRANEPYRRPSISGRRYEADPMARSEMSTPARVLTCLESRSLFPYRVFNTKMEGLMGFQRRGWIDNGVRKTVEFMKLNVAILNPLNLICLPFSKPSMSELAGISFSGDILEGNSQNETREEHDEYSTIRLEAYELTEQAPTTNASEKETNASWTIYELSEPSKFRPSIVTSPKMSEIIAEDEMEPGYLASTASIQISVSNPKKSEETSKLGIRTTFTTYFVQSETSLADYPFTKRAVWRRYKDFDVRTDISI